MPTKRTKDTAQLGAAINKTLKASLCRYARRRGETVRAVLERAIRREMTYPPPTPAEAPLPEYTQ